MRKFHILYSLDAQCSQNFLSYAVYLVLLQQLLKMLIQASDVLKKHVKMVHEMHAEPVRIHWKEMLSCPTAEDHNNR